MSANLVVISGPSGVGKTDLSHKLAKNGIVKKVISCTTRAPRPDEVDGKDYRFFDREEFNSRIAGGEFVEKAEVYDHLYGTLYSDLDQEIASGEVVMLVMDYQGLLRVASLYPEAQTIFLIAPVRDLERRLNERKMNEEDRQKRISAFIRELADARSPFVRHIVDNSDGGFDDAFRRTCSIIAEKTTRSPHVDQ